MLFSFTPRLATAISTLSLHDALPICGAAELPGPLLRPVGAGEAGAGAAERGRRAGGPGGAGPHPAAQRGGLGGPGRAAQAPGVRSEEHTSELQSRFDLVCRLLLEKKK